MVSCVALQLLAKVCPHISSMPSILPEVWHVIERLWDMHFELEDKYSGTSI